MAAMPPPATVTVLSWNIQILGKKKSDRLLGLNLLAAIIKRSGADVVAIQELVYSEASPIQFWLTQALKELGERQWTGAAVQALPGGADRDGYLFLWRSDRYQQLNVAGKDVAGVFGGDFPNNFSPRNGRRPGFVGLSSLGGVAFLVAAYHAPTYARLSVGSAPATGLAAIAAQAGQLTHSAGGAPYGAWFLCADFNLDINGKDGAADSYTRWYKPLLDNAKGKEVTRDKTFLAPLDVEISPAPTSSADYLIQNLDNILAGPAAKVVPGKIFDTIELFEDPEMKKLAESFLAANPDRNEWPPRDLKTSYVFARTFLSDHLPVIATFQLSP